MGNSIILTLADGGDETDLFDGKYLQLQAISRIFYNEQFCQVDKTSPDIHGLKFEIVDSTCIYIIREEGDDDNSSGFVVESDEKRTEIIQRLIDKMTLSEDLIIIAHQGIDTAISVNNRVMCYRTGGDDHTECEWEVVCEIVAACLSDPSSLSFEDIKNKIEYCTIKKIIRKIIFKLECLIAPLNIGCQGKDSNEVIDIDPLISTSINRLLNEEPPLIDLLNKGNYLTPEEILKVMASFEGLPAGALEVVKIKDLWKEFYQSLQFINQKVFFSSVDE